MKELTQTIAMLLEQLNAGAIDPGSAEAKAHKRLVLFLTAIESGDRNAMNTHLQQLHDFWLNQVPWCSDLSRQLEKVLIQFEEHFRQS